MNPLTQVRNTQKITKKEIELGLGEAGSWHARFKHSAYIFAGALDFGLTEGDLLAVFAQYGEIMDVNLVRDKTTGKSRGFAFLAYEDQRSTVLAVDNLNGARVAGRIMRVEHVDNYKKRKAELDGEEEGGNDAGKEGAHKGAALPAGVGAQVSQSTQAGVHGLGPGSGAPGDSGRLGGGSDPWAAGNSLFSLLKDGGPGGGAGGPPAAGQAKETKEKKERREKKQKKEKKHKAKEKKTKHRGRSRSRSRSSSSRSRSRSPAAGGGACPAPTGVNHKPEAHARAGFGPPRPPGSASVGATRPLSGPALHEDDGARHAAKEAERPDRGHGRAADRHQWRDRRPLSRSRSPGRGRERERDHTRSRSRSRGRGRERRRSRSVEDRQR